MLRRLTGVLGLLGLAVGLGLFQPAVTMPQAQARPGGPNDVVVIGTVFYWDGTVWQELEGVSVEVEITYEDTLGVLRTKAVWSSYSTVNGSFSATFAIGTDLPILVNKSYTPGAWTAGTASHVPYTTPNCRGHKGISLDSNGGWVAGTYALQDGVGLDYGYTPDPTSPPSP